MLTPEQQKIMRAVTKGVEDAQELLERFYQGNTNHDGSYVQNAVNTARKKFEETINSFTQGKETMRSAQQEETESFTLKPTQQVFEVTPIQMQKIIAKELGVPEARLTITALPRDDSGSFSTTNTVEFSTTNSVEFSTTVWKIIVKGE